MAKKRYISDSIWTDNWFENQTPEKKLLFIYLITNKLVSICWFYEITIRQISFDTWINQKDIEKYLLDFEDDKKIFFYNWIICIVNFVKNQNINSIEDNLYKWIVREIKELWEEKLIKLLSYKGLMTTLQGAYKVVPIPYLTLLNFTLLNYTYQEDENFWNQKEIIEQEKWNFSPIIKKDKKEFREVMKENLNLEDFKQYGEREYLKLQLKEFYLYRTEKNQNWKKQKWEMQKTFDVSLRFHTWCKRSHTYFKPKNEKYSDHENIESVF